jgi:hypothetical protein
MATSVSNKTLSKAGARKLTAIALPLVSTDGMEEIMSKIWPIIENAMAMKIVL